MDLNEKIFNMTNDEAANIIRNLIIDATSASIRGDFIMMVTNNIALKKAIKCLKENPKAIISVSKKESISYDLNDTCFLSDNTSISSNDQNTYKKSTFLDNMSGEFTLPNVNLLELEPFKSGIITTTPFVLTNKTFKTNKEAMTIVRQLKDTITKYGRVSVSEFYYLIGVPSTLLDDQYGWTKLLTKTIVKTVDNQWIIMFPKIIKL